MLDKLAWLLATYPDAKSRDGAEAVQLAERGCALTDRRIPALLDTLAVAYAEAGDFARANELIGVMNAFEELRSEEQNGTNVTVVKAALRRSSSSPA